MTSSTPGDKAESILDQITDRLTTDQALALAGHYAALAVSDALLSMAEAITNQPNTVIPKMSPEALEALKAATLRAPQHFQIINTEPERRTHPSDIKPLVDALRSHNRISATAEELEWIRSYLTTQESLRLRQHWDSTDRTFVVSLSSPEPYDHQGEQNSSSQAYEQTAEHQEYQQDYEERYGVTGEHPLDASIPVVGPEDTEGTTAAPTGPAEPEGTKTPGNVRVKPKTSAEKPTGGVNSPTESTKLYPPRTSPALKPQHIYDAVRDLMNGRTIATKTQKTAHEIQKALPGGTALSAPVHGSYADEPVLLWRVKTIPTPGTLKALEDELGLPPGLIRDPEDDETPTTAAE